MRQFGDMNNALQQHVITCLIYYYSRDLDQVHLICKGLLYGDMDQKLLIDDEPNKAL